MAGPVSRTAKSIDKEVLKFPAGLDAIESVVILASGVSALPSAVAGFAGKIGLQAGTILTKIPGDSKKRYRQFTGAPGEVIEGVLGDNKFFYSANDESDTGADMLFHNCVFDASKIVDYAAREVALKAALTTCLFDETDL